MIDLENLRALIAVRDHGTVVAASESLGFTPSAVSQQVKRLEGQINAKLLERVGRSVLLTEHGRLLAEKGVMLLADLEELESLAQLPDAPIHGTLRIASFSTANRGLIAPLLGRLSRVAPHLALTLIELDPWDSIALVERGGAELALVHNWSTVALDVPASLTATALCIDRVDVLLHRDHPLASREAVTPADIAEETWVCTPVGTICHEGLTQLFAGAGHRATIAYYDGDFSTHVAFVEQQAAVALVPRLGRDILPPTVIAVPIVDPVPYRQVELAWRRSTTANPGLQLVRRELETLVDRRGAGQDVPREG